MITKKKQKKQKDGLNGYAYDVSIVYNTIDVNDIVYIHKSLMKEKHEKNCFVLSFSESLAAKYISLNYEPCLFRPKLINLNELHYYHFMVSLDRSVGSCNTPGGSYGTICVPNKTEDVSLNEFNMIEETNEPKTLIKLM